MLHRKSILTVLLQGLTLLGFLCLTAGTAFAQTITPATGGGAISADNSSGAYTPLTGPVYAEAANGDVGVGTIILNASAGFIFDTGGTAPTVLVTRTSGTGPNSRNINDLASGTSAAITSISTTQITFTVTAASSNNVTNSLTWQNVRVRPSAGTPLASGNITKSGTSTMAGVTTGVTNFGTLTEVAGAMNMLVVVLPGQAFVAGTGATGAPTAQTASSSFVITSIRATDQFVNIVTSYSGAKTLSYNGPGGTPAYTTAVSFTNGASTTTLTTTLRKAETTTMTVTEGAVSGPASSNLTVNPGAYTKMQLLVPGETADPGTASGKIGSPSNQTAGSSFMVTVNAVDADWNLVSSTHTVGITSSDPNATLPANNALVGGTRTFSVILKTAGSRTITATNISDGTKSPSTSPGITVNPGAFEKLQLLVPGETADPGSVTGKTGSPSAQTAGTPFNVTVNAVDAYWNLVSSTNTIQITSSDVNAPSPANNALVAGNQTFSVILKTAGAATVTAVNVTDPSKTSSTSPSVAVNAGAFTKMQLLVPGETADPGSATGKTGTPDPQTAGLNFQVVVQAVDADWNLVSSAHTVRITSSDGTATLPPDAALVAGFRTFDVTLNTAGSATVTASNLTDPAKTADTSPSITVNPAGAGTLTETAGGDAISADNVSGSFVTLTGPVYEEGGSGNIQAGTLTLNAPTGFEFDTGGLAPNLLIQRTAGAGPDANNINGVTSGSTISATSVTSTAITFTILSPSVSGVENSVTWQNIRVRPTFGNPLASGNLTKSGDAVIAGVTGATNFGTLTEVAGAFDNLFVTLPGETFNEGSGNSGTPDAQTAGSAFNIASLTATDQFLNVALTYSGLKTIGYSGPGGEPSYTTSVNFTNGVSTTPLSTTLRRAESAMITASEGSVTGPASSSVTVNPASYTKLQLLVPSESAAPGTAAGKTGSPIGQAAGTSLNVTVRAVDNYFNLVSSTHTIAITASDVYALLPDNAALVGGTQTFSVTFRTAGSWTVTGSNVTDPSKAASTSPSITVDPDAFTKMQLLVPGETADPGSPAGKTGTPIGQAIASPIVATVNAVDANWNLVSSTNTVGITSSDGAANLPANAALVGGTKDFSVTLNTAGSQTITASNITDPTKTASTSPFITVAAVSITPATGGSAISADNTDGAFTSLTGPSYDEAASGDVGTGTITLNAPAGFEFDIGGTAPTVLITRLTGGGNASRNINGIVSGNSVAVSSVTASQITFTVTSASNSGVTCGLTWQNIRVRPTAGTPLASGNITKSGTSGMTGVTAGATNLGTLTEVHGAHTNLVITVPGETFTAGSGNSGMPSSQTAGTAFDLTGIMATDQFLNIVTSYSGAQALSYFGPSGSPTYTTNVNFTNGQSTTTLTTTLTAVETTTLTANDGGVSGPASSLLTVNAPVKTWDGGAATSNWSDDVNWSPDGVPGPLNDVNLTGAVSIVVDADADANNLTLNNSGLNLTIQSGFSLTVAGDYLHQSGTLATASSFPSVSGTVALAGGTVAYTAASGSQTIEALTYQMLIISGGGTKALAGNSTIAGDLLITGGTLDLGSGSLNRLSPGGSIMLSGGATMLVGGNTGGVSGSNFPDNFSTRTLDGTVDFNRAGNQSLPPFVFANLMLSNSGAKTFGTGMTSISGSLSVTGSATADFITNSTTMQYTGSVQTIEAGTYHSLVLGGGAKSTSGNITVNSNFTNSAVTSLGTNTLSVSGTKTNSGTMLFAGAANGVVFGDGTVEYNGTSAQVPAGQIIAVGLYNNLLISNDAVKRVTGGIVHTQSPLTIGVGVMLTVESDGDLQVDGDLENDGTLTNDGLITVGN